VISCFIQHWRRYEVGKFGEPDINGVIRAKKESLFGTFEVLVSSILFGYIVNFLSGLTPKEFHANAMFHYWILMDCMLMFFTLGYVYAIKFL